MMGEAMDSVGESMGNEEEEEELYNQVLQEAGVKLEGDMVGAGNEALGSQVKKGPQEIGVWPQGSGGAGGAGSGAGAGAGAGMGAGNDDLDAMLASLNQK